MRQTNQHLLRDRHPIDSAGNARDESTNFCSPCLLSGAAPVSLDYFVLMSRHNIRVEDSAFTRALTGGFWSCVSCSNQQGFMCICKGCPRARTLARSKRAAILFVHLWLWIYMVYPQDWYCSSNCLQGTSPVVAYSLPIAATCPAFFFSGEPVINLLV